MISIKAPGERPALPVTRRRAAGDRNDRLEPKHDADRPDSPGRRGRGRRPAALHAPASKAALDQAVGFAAILKGKVTGLALEVEIAVKSNRIADYLVGLSGLVHSEEAKSRQACRDGLAYFAERAEAAGVFGGALSGRADLFHCSDVVAARTITRDLCMLSLGGQFDDQVDFAQTVAFSASAPVVIYKPGEADLPTKSPWAGMEAVVPPARCAMRSHSSSSQTKFGC